MPRIVDLMVMIGMEAELVHVERLATSVSPDKTEDPPTPVPVLNDGPLRWPVTVPVLGAGTSKPRISG